MTGLLKFAVVALTLTTACLAQERLVTVSDKGKHKWPAEKGRQDLPIGVHRRAKRIWR
jgi:hypothetical protein